MLCDRPGRALAVCVNPDQSPPLLDGQRHQHKEKVTGCTQARPDEVSKEVSTEHWASFTDCEAAEEFLQRKNQMTTVLNYFCSNSPVTRCVSKVLRCFIALIDIPLGCTNLQMSSMWHSLDSLMIRVNTANSFRFYRRAGRNDTIAKIQPIWGKKQETALNGPECTAPRGATSITVTRPRRRTLEEVIAKMEIAAYACVCV